MTDPRPIDELTQIVIRESIAIHRAIGPGLFESVYEATLAAALESEGLRVERQVGVPLRYRNIAIADAYRIDLLVDRRVLVEIKSLEKLAPVHAQQTLTYLRLSRLSVALLLNFGAPTMKEGTRRFVNGYTDQPQ